MQGIGWAILTALGALLALAYYAFVVVPARLHRLHCDGLRAFARLIELRSGGRYGRVEPFLEWSKALASRLNLSLRERRQLELAIYLRDIGMVAIPYQTLHKRERLTEAERILLARHAEIGAAIVEQIPGLRQVAPIVRLHHVVYAEQPEAPLSAHLLSALEDCLPLIVAGELETALKTLQQGAGTRYHPLVVQAILSEVRAQGLSGRRDLARSAALWL
ncbi:MAG: hypothetical protein NZ550_02080 [Fimbriimonadales bacterium]|nr:hypothetical protein [Fimbriimonadales bacterium]MDW8051877.1 hypothetical protein [Armatimonadota bacterium]